jgi:transcriptional regulator with XRE-family HTH domain
MTPEQCRAGRALLNWSQDDLSERSRVAARTIRSFEAGGRITEANRASLERALVDGDVIFVAENGEGPGVRLKKKKAKS